MKRYSDIGDELDDAIDHIAHQGWPSHDLDVALANNRYSEWLAATSDVWVGSARRDRETLFDSILSDMCAYHGDSDGPYYSMLLMLMMEVRARRDNVNERGLTN